MCGTVIDRPDDFLNFARCERTVFIIETVTSTVGSGNVKLHQVYVLAKDVSGRAYLEVIDIVVVGNKVGVPVLNDVAAVSTEEQWFGRTSGGAAGSGELNCV